MEINEKEIYSFQLISGREIVARVSKIHADSYDLSAPLAIGQGPNGLEFTPVMVTTDFAVDSKLVKSSISLISTTRPDVREAYETSVDPSEIITPGKKQIITG